MKKLLVFRDNKLGSRLELDDYLLDAEVVRGDFIDMNPEEEATFTIRDKVISATTWEVIFKGDDQYDHWHLLVDHPDSYEFDEPKHRMALALFDTYRNEHITITAVLHTHGHYVVILRMRKAMSRLINAHLPAILESFNDTTYTYQIPESELGSVVSPIPKEEADKDS